MSQLNTSIKTFLKPYCLDYIGFADLTNYEADLVRFGGNIVKGYQSGISLGLVIPDSIVDHLPERDDPNVACEYRTHAYEIPNNRLNYIASVLSSYLNGKGYRTLPIPAANRTDEENGIPTVSHKMIAHLAGLGWIGKNCLLITPEHGPRVRFISLLTNAPLATNSRMLDQRCGECTACVAVCPMHALKGVNFRLGDERDVRFDFKKCDNYFAHLNKTLKYPVCGMCLYACPFGKTH